MPRTYIQIEGTSQRLEGAATNIAVVNIVRGGKYFNVFVDVDKLLTAVAPKALSNRTRSTVVAGGAVKVELQYQRSA